MIDDLEGFERLEMLQIKTRKAGEILYDLHEKGPLYEYLLHARDTAMHAIENFAYIDLNNMNDVAVLQAEVRLYIEALQWANTRIEQGEIAAQDAAEEFDNVR